MSDNESLSSDAQNGTLYAVDQTTGKVIYFPDYVRHDDVVEVYRSAEAAAAERGQSRTMRVKWSGDEWVLEPAS